MSASARHGPTGPPGPPGAGDKTYRHQQLSAATVWHVAHMLGKYPTTEVWDSAGDQWDAVVEHVDLNNLTITFPSATGGESHHN